MKDYMSSVLARSNGKSADFCRLAVSPGKRRERGKVLELQCNGCGNGTKTAARRRRRKHCDRSVTSCGIVRPIALDVGGLRRHAPALASTVGSALIQNHSRPFAFISGP